ncbi:hypothetical protein FN846DRAFT_346468 [Sphaerosporella brunnea]|uniref:Rhodopsin domain-containing protein n=1 Tax=Sphaerosporella brunnea TaxID=1250544 RepID=A0A5J5EJM7_9PEZI|nr:hypothetical protein FN846DRAFT_346468 [Sphaerosporella brunnea]
MSMPSGTSRNTTTTTTTTTIETRAQTIQIVDYSLLALVIVAVSARLYSRVRIIRKVFFDDVCILLATALLLALIAIHTVMVLRYSWGQHNNTVSASSLVKQVLFGQLCRILYPPTTTLIRLSVLVFVRRLSPHSWIYYTTILLIILNILYALIFTLLIIIECNPVHASFAYFCPSHTICLKGRMLALATLITSVALDIYTWMIPVILILRVQLLGWRKKLGAVVLLGIGLLACIAGAMRLPRIQDFFTKMYDYSWLGVPIGIWTVIEISIGILAASIPATAPLMIHLSRRFIPWGTPPRIIVIPDIEAVVADEECGKTPCTAEAAIEMRKYQSTEVLWSGGVEGVEWDGGGRERGGTINSFSGSREDGRTMTINSAVESSRD